MPRAAPALDRASARAVPWHRLPPRRRLRGAAGSQVRGSRPEHGRTARSDRPGGGCRPAAAPEREDARPAAVFRAGHDRAGAPHRGSGPCAGRRRAARGARVKAAPASTRAASPKKTRNRRADARSQTLSRPRSSTRVAMNPQIVTARHTRRQAATAALGSALRLTVVKLCWCGRNSSLESPETIPPSAPGRSRPRPPRGRPAVARASCAPPARGSLAAPRCRRPGAPAGPP